MDKQVCVDEGCFRLDIYARRLCPAHYQAARAAGKLPPSEAVDRPCAQCGELMVGRKSARARYCTTRCKDKAKAEERLRVTQESRGKRACKQCGASIVAEAYGRRQFCSDGCRIRWNNQREAARKHASSMQKRAVRPPCKNCGGVIPKTRRNGSVFCSRDCSVAVNGKRWKERSSDYMRQYLYGISQAEFTAIMASQGGACAICKTTEWPGKGPHVDHDHVSGMVRGILCHRCNIAIGQLNDDPALFEAAALYIRSHRPAAVH